VVDVHKSFAKGYCLAFLERHVRGDEAFDLFLAHGAVPATVAAVEHHAQYQETGALVVDDFEQPGANPELTNTLGQAVAVAGATVTERALTRLGTPSFVHATSGGMIVWTAAGGTYTSQLGSRDVSAFQVLAFRVAQRNGSAQNPAGAAKDFSVRLTDDAARTATLAVSSATTIPAAILRGGATKSTLKTVRLRLDAFKAANPNLNLAALTAITFEFNVTPQGEVAVDDIEFSL
jgi:hypothetical protein